MKELGYRLSRKEKKENVYKKSPERTSPISTSLQRGAGPVPEEGWAVEPAEAVKGVKTGHVFALESDPWLWRMEGPEAGGIPGEEPDPPCVAGGVGACGIVQPCEGPVAADRAKHHKAVRRAPHGAVQEMEE